jgi:hypothetical protein
MIAKYGLLPAWEVTASLLDFIDRVRLALTKRATFSWVSC